MEHLHGLGLVAPTAGEKLLQLHACLFLVGCSASAVEAPGASLRRNEGGQIGKLPGLQSDELIAGLGGLQDAHGRLARCDEPAGGNDPAVLQTQLDRAAGVVVALLLSWHEAAAADTDHDRFPVDLPDELLDIRSGHPGAALIVTVAADPVYRTVIGTLCDIAPISPRIVDIVSSLEDARALVQERLLVDKTTHASGG